MGWINIGDKLPNEADIVPVLYRNKTVYAFCYKSEFYFHCYVNMLETCFNVPSMENGVVLKDISYWFLLENPTIGYEMNKFRSKSLCEEDGYFPPPWNPREHPEKTLGWLEFQKALKDEPQYYGKISFPNASETE